MTKYGIITYTEVVLIVKLITRKASYEYVEYGTCNRVVVYLQKIGFTRESAIYIYSQHKDKIIIKDNMIVELKSSLLKCPKISEEVQRVKYNYRNLFNE